MKSVKKAGAWILILIVLTITVLGYTNTIFSDIDNDGDIDLFLEHLIENKNTGTSFVRLNATDGIGNIVGVTQAYFIDTSDPPDGLDELLFIMREGRVDFLYRNNFDKTFTNITGTALGKNLTGVANSPKAAVFADFDKDNVKDCLVNGVFLLSNGTGFDSVNGTDIINKTGLANIPRMDQFIPIDLNIDNNLDIIGVTESKEVKVYLNLGDNNADGIPEFYDATYDLQLDAVTQANFLATGNISYGLAVNRTLNGFYPFNGKTPPFVEDAWYDMYVVRNQTQNLLLIQTYPEIPEQYSSARFYLPTFEDLSNYSTNVNAITNGTAAIITDFDNNTGADILYAGNSSGTKIMLRNGSSWKLDFTTGASLSVNPKIIQAADLNNDGFLDLAAIESEIIRINSQGSGSSHFNIFEAGAGWSTSTENLVFTEATSGELGIPFSGYGTLYGINERLSGNVCLLYTSPSPRD